MKQFDSKTFTQEEMEAMCNIVQPNSVLNVLSEMLEFNGARKNLDRLVEEGYALKGSALQQGIKAIGYDENKIMVCETPLQYPAPKLIERINSGKESACLLGPMTGIFAHVFQNDVYVAHVRGEGIAAPGKIQIVAGMGEFSIYPSENALKEVREEAEIEQPQLVLDRNKFLDVTPFMKAGKFPQPLFSYIVTGGLSHITTYIKNDKELESFRASLPEKKTKEAYSFLIPMECLRDFVEEIDKLGKFYGPVKRTALNFLKWYNQEFFKSY